MPTSTAASESGSLLRLLAATAAKPRVVIAIRKKPKPAPPAYARRYRSQKYVANSRRMI